MTAPPTHPERVAAAVPDDCKIVALLHDAIEDGHVTYGTAMLALEDGYADALFLVTRTPDLTYADYIDRMVEWARGRGIIQQAGRIAIAVKIADLHDNLYGRPEGPPPGSLRRRYEKTLAVLEAASA